MVEFDTSFIDEEALAEPAPHKNGKDLGADKTSDIHRADPPKPRFKPVRFRNIKLSTTALYLVKGLIPRAGLVVIWGPPKCGKSFWTFDLGMHLALDWDYRGRRVSAGGVVYIACEGEQGLSARKEAFLSEKLTGDEDPPFFLLPTRLDLVADAEKLTEDIRNHTDGEEIVAIVIDTLNRTIAGSESRDEDMGAYVKAADKLRETFNAAVLIIHHCGINSERPRGHTSLTGAADAQIAVKRDDDNNIICRLEYMKDGPEGDEIASRLKVVKVAEDDEGDPVESCIIVPAAVSDKPTHQKMTPAEARVFDLLCDAINTEGKLPPADGKIPEKTACVREDTWRSYCARASITKSDKPDAKRMAFNRASDALINRLHRVRTWDGWVWTVPE